MKKLAYSVSELSADSLTAYQDDHRWKHVSEYADRLMWVQAVQLVLEIQLSHGCFIGVDYDYFKNLDSGWWVSQTNFRL